MLALAETGVTIYGKSPQLKQSGPNLSTSNNANQAVVTLTER